MIKSIKSLVTTWSTHQVYLDVIQLVWLVETFKRSMSGSGERENNHFNSSFISPPCFSFCFLSWWSLKLQIINDIKTTSSNSLCQLKLQIIVIMFIMLITIINLYICLLLFHFLFIHLNKSTILIWKLFKSLFGPSWTSI